MGRIDAHGPTTEVVTKKVAAHLSTVTALRKALEAAGIEFIDENGGGAGVRLRKRASKRSK